MMAGAGGGGGGGPLSQMTEAVNNIDRPPTGPNNLDMFHNKVLISLYFSVHLFDNVDNN